MKLHSRIIKPDYWSDGDLLRWPMAKRYFYLGLWQIADDSGCLTNDPFEFKLMLFPSPVDSEITLEKLEEWTKDLIACGKLIAYEVDGKRCLFMKNFHKHQKIDNPSAPTVPLPEWITWVPFASNPRAGKYAFADGKVIGKDRKSKGDTEAPDDSLTNPLQIPSKRIEDNTREGNINTPQSPPMGEQPPALDLIPPEETQPVYDEHNPEPEFMHLWEQYGRVGERLPAYRAWKRMKAKPHAQQLLTDETDKLVKRYLTYCQHTKTPQKHLASWLNQEAYAGYRDGPDFEAKRAEVKRAIAEQQQREEREERRTTSEGRRQQGADMEAVI